MKKLIVLVGIVSLFVFNLGWSSIAEADGCYICGSGSACGDYCRYTGGDDFNNRKKCEAAGCKVSGTASCPTAANYKVCTAGLEKDLGPFTPKIAASDVKDLNIPK